jgi:hypothetical protein
MGKGFTGTFEMNDAWAGGWDKRNMIAMPYVATDEIVSPAMGASSKDNDVKDGKSGKDGNAKARARRALLSKDKKDSDADDEKDKAARREKDSAALRDEAAASALLLAAFEGGKCSSHKCKEAATEARKKADKAAAAAASSSGGVARVPSAFAPPPSALNAASSAVDQASVPMADLAAEARRPRHVSL